MVGLIVFAMAVVLTACSGNGTVPATAPPTSVTSSSGVPMTTSDLPTTSQATTTTVDRVAEIEAVLLDLEIRNLQAQVDRDEAAFRAIYANAGFEERSMQAYNEDLFRSMPSSVEVEVVDVLYDDGECVAVLHLTTVDGQRANNGLALITVLELMDGRGWGISFSGEGWACEGPHPFGDS
ncbi:MAG: hypothetical protein GXP36_14560 [Actinobacteria bacterium]|nr:hypothetical protein [Actinomycetota bacterium]